MMSEENSPSPLLETLPEPVIQTRRPLSIVWIVPLVAAVIGGWLIYKAYTEQGPTITISFKSAEGLQTGRTKIKFKEVEVGQVKRLSLSEDLARVVVTAEMDKDMEKHLTEETRFWIVSARVAAGEITGLGTILTGAYIGVDPGKPGPPKYNFMGLDTPPVVTTDLPGRHFVLLADKMGSLDSGSLVYFRQNKVGQVVGHQLLENGEAVNIKIFIHAPYDKFVRKNTRFWNAGGVDLALDATGLKISTESVTSILFGGIAFETPANLEPGGPAEEGSVFKLYESREKINARVYEKKMNFLLHFSGSVRGLSIGAPVEFRGIKVGQVLDIKLELDWSQRDFRIPVLIELEPERIAEVGENPSERVNLLDALIRRGLRAQLQTASLLTGQLFVAMDFHPGLPPLETKPSGPYPEIPTLPTPLDEISGEVKKVIERIKNLPVEEIGGELRDTLRALNRTLKRTERLMANLDTKLTPQADAALKQAQSTLTSAQRVLASDSPLQHDLRKTLGELTEAARSLAALVEYLDRHPESLLRGKGNQK
ncbi:MAG: MlaD family protein [Thermodesulfobacteriota bacterium]